jgi:hypothetical protein
MTAAASSVARIRKEPSPAEAQERQSKITALAAKRISGRKMQSIPANDRIGFFLNARRMERMAFYPSEAPARYGRRSQW